MRLSSYRERVHGQPCDVTDPAQVGALWDGAVGRWGRVDIWINNAGVAQEYLRAWELPTEEVIRLVETNILGVMHGSRTAMRGMRAQGGGAIYNMEGWGSDGKRRRGLSVYGTTKRAVRYFTRALADEASARESAGDEAFAGGEMGGGMLRRRRTPPRRGLRTGRRRPVSRPGRESPPRGRRLTVFSQAGYWWGLSVPG